MSGIETPIEKPIAGLKFGSDLVADAETGGIKHEAIEAYAEQIAVVRQQFSPVVFTSGAAASGKAYLESEGIDTSEFGAQELAGAGTDEISKAWKKALIVHKIVGVQVLANHDQMKQGSVLMRTLLHGIGLGIVYLINENDQENLFELELYEEEEQRNRQEGNGKRVKKPGVDNDFLSARGMVALKEELAAQGLTDEQISLVLFTAVGGFMLDGVVQSEIHGKDRDYLVSRCDGKSEGGSGGMEFKINAGFLAAQSGVRTRIASPQHDFLDALRGVNEEGVSIGTSVLHDATIG